MRGHVGQFLKVASAGYDLVRPPGTGLAVLAYHRVGGRTAVSVDLPTQLFIAQLRFIKERYHALTLDEAVRHFNDGEPPRGKPAVVVTFDDGTADFCEEAVPVLVEHGVPAALYVATQAVEDQREFPNGGRPTSWGALADALSTGLVTIGSHTHSHLLLDRADGLTAADELDRSVGLIADRLGVAARHFAYPKALLGSPAAEAAVRARFRSAAVAGTHLNRWASTDLHRLARSPIQVTDGMCWFSRKVEGGLRLEDALRVRANHRRYHGLSH